MALKFYRDVAENLASRGKDKNGAVVPDGSIIFTSDTNRIYMKNGTEVIPYGNGDGEAEVADFEKAAISVGELAAGTTLEGKTAMEILTLILDAEYAPMWTAASFGAVSGGKTLSVGDSVPSKSSFSVTGAHAASASASNQNIVTGGSVTTSIDDNDNFGKTIESRQVVTVTGSTSIAAGNDEVVSSKGTPTNKTAGNKTTKLANATVNSKINASTHKINSDSGTPSSASIYFAYPIYIPGATKLEYNAPDSKTGYQFKWNCATNKQFIIAVPSVCKNVVIGMLDTVQNVFFKINDDAAAITTENKSIGSNNVSVPYTIYTCDTHYGDATYRLTFNY